MGILRFRIAAKISIVFGKSFIEFIRNQTYTKPLDVTYSNATGQSVTANQVLYTYLNPGVDGYIEIKSNVNQVLNGTGVLNLSMTHRVSNTQSQQNINFYFDSSPISIDINYNSKPESEDIIIDIPNRLEYIFKVSDFIDKYNDYDGDLLDQVSIYGNVNGYEINSNPYFEGGWISINDIFAGLLTYIPIDQDAYYEKDNTWKAMDINGNISDTANIKIKVDGYNIKEASVNSDWENHELNYTLHEYLSDSIDGISVDKIKITSISSALGIDNNGSIVNVGDEILMSNMNSGLVIIGFNHVFPSGILEYQAIGSTIFNVKLTINSIV